MRFKHVAVLLSAMIIGLTTKGFAASYPQPTGFVNDFAQVLSVEDGRMLNDELIAFEQRTSIQVTVVTVPSLDGRDIADYTAELGNAWGVGQAGRDNGVIFLIAPNDRQVRISPANGVSHLLPTVVTDRILRHDVLRRFKAGDMSGGIIAGTRAILTALETTPKPATVPDPLRPWTKSDTTFLLVLVGVISLVLFIVFMVHRFLMRKQARIDTFNLLVELNTMASEGLKLYDHSDVKPENRDTYVRLDSKRRQFPMLVSETNEPDWFALRLSAEELRHELSNVNKAMSYDIDFAKRARAEAPKLLAKIPELLAAAEAKLAEGKPSEEARERLAEARRKYDEARQTASSSDQSMVNWLILYLILSDSQSSVAAAESAHRYANEDHSSYSSRRSSDSSSSSGYGFGDSGGFGGGGGFSSSSGSSGGW